MPADRPRTLPPESMELLERWNLDHGSGFTNITWRSLQRDAKKFLREVEREFKGISEGSKFLLRYSHMRIEMTQVQEDNALQKRLIENHLDQIILTAKRDQLAGVINIAESIRLAAETAQAARKYLESPDNRNCWQVAHKLEHLERSLGTQLKGA